MNRSDVRAMGVGSAAAIVVSLVTVIVYEGHVKATSNGQTVNIQPGSTMSFGEKPTPPEQLTIGGSDLDRRRIAELEREVAKLKFELLNRQAEDLARDAKDPKKIAKDTTDSTDEKDTNPIDNSKTCDEVSCVLTNYDGPCCDKYKKAKVVADAPCDAKALVKKGDDYLSNGMDGAALVYFEKSLACKVDPAIRKKALLAACRSKNEAKARAHYATLPASIQSSYAQICLRFGIGLGPDDTCDAQAAKVKGDDHMSSGKDAAALAQYEQSLRCKMDSEVLKKAFLASCRSKNAAKAKLYFAKMPPNLASNYTQICLRYGIDTTDVTKATTGTLRIAATPAAKIEIDGVRVGETPLEKQLPVGKHKVTFVVGESKYTWSVNIEADKVTTLNKDFEAQP